MKDDVLNIQENITYRWILYLLNNVSSNCYYYKARLHNLLVFSNLLYYRKYNENILSINPKVSSKGFFINNLDELLLEMEKSELIGIRYGIYGVYIVPLESYDKKLYTTEELYILDIINNTINQLSNSLLESYAVNNLSWSKDKINTTIKLSDINIGEFAEFINNEDEEEYIEYDKSSEDKKDLYVVTTVSLKNKTENDIKKEYEIYKIKYPVWKVKTYENFCDFLKTWNWYDYNISKEDNSYFLNLNEAKDMVIRNIGDINDGGVYNYVLIKKIPLKTIYANTNAQEYYLFKFDKHNRMYKELDVNNDCEARRILKAILSNKNY